MVDTQHIPQDRSLYLFELDNVLFPRIDYMAQVYYLFASFYEFTTGKVQANEMAVFMKKIHDLHGESSVFATIQVMYAVDDIYLDNFERLKANAQLPLKLMIYPEVESFILNLFQSNKSVGILTSGNPVEQLNKLKFMNWRKLDNFKHNLKIYFNDELKFKSINPIDYIAEEYELKPADIFVVDKL